MINSILGGLILGMILVFLTDIFFFRYSVKEALNASFFYGIIFSLCVGIVKLLFKV